MEKEYHKRVWRASHKEAWGVVFSDKEVLAGNFVLSIVSWYVSSHLLEIWGQAIMISPIFHIVTIALATIAGFFALYVFRLFGNGFWYMPAKLFREKEEIINQREWGDIFITEHTFSKHSGFGVGLEIKSNKAKNDIFTIRHITPILVLTKSKGKHQSVHYFFSVIQDSTSFWNGGQLLPNTSSYIPIANTDGNNAWIEYKEKQEFEPVIQKIQMEENIEYTIQLAIGGRIGASEIEMEKFFLECSLLYTNKKELKITIISRQPEFIRE